MYTINFGFLRYNANTGSYEPYADEFTYDEFAVYDEAEDAWELWGRGLAKEEYLGRARWPQRVGTGAYSCLSWGDEILEYEEYTHDDEERELFENYEFRIERWYTNDSSWVEVDSFHDRDEADRAFWEFERLPGMRLARYDFDGQLKEIVAEGGK
jgi:hypothetical protein